MFDLFHVPSWNETAIITAITAIAKNPLRAIFYLFIYLLLLLRRNIFNKLLKKKRFDHSMRTKIRWWISLEQYFYFITVKSLVNWLYITNIFNANLESAQVVFKFLFCRNENTFKRVNVLTETTLSCFKYLNSNWESSYTKSFRFRHAYITSKYIEWFLLVCEWMRAMSQRTNTHALVKLT